MHDNDTVRGGEPARKEDRPPLSERETLPVVSSMPDQVRDAARGRARDEEPDPLINAKLDNFHVLSLLGKGGFGKVFRARDMALARDVAIKLLHDPSPGTDSRHQALFEREAKALAALSEHDSIVEIYQWGEYKGQNYFALEFVESSAEKLLEEYPDGMPLAVALRIALECAEALQAAHEQGILHRDIKPPNILINPKNGRAKVADFGLARLRTSGEFTIEGTISGSPTYMSPEQARGAVLDERSDIYSLGTSLYEFLSGKRPVEGHSATEIMEHIVKDERVPLSERRPDLPEGVCAIVDKATAYQCSDRYQSASEFARELRIALNALERTGSIPEAIPDEPSYPRLKRAGIAAAILAVLTVVAILLGRIPPGAQDRGDDKKVLAAAVTAMNAGDFVSAEAGYRGYLNQHPSDTEALFGRGLALALLDDLVGAETEFGKITDDTLRRQGDAAIAFERGGAAAREIVEGAASAGGAGYAKLLLAKLDAFDGQHKAAAQRLEEIAGSLPYNWQKRDAQRALGQAYYRQGRYDDAQRVFQAVQGASGPGADVMAAAYLAAIARKTDAALRQETIDRARSIREMIDSGPGPTSEFDAWTSRPLTCYIPPAETGTSRYAVESGLADLLPLLLADRIDADTPINVVERELIQEILAEQELSAYVSSGPGQLMLGRVLGARLLIQCSFGLLGGTERVSVKMVDIETTDLHVESVDVPRRMEPEELIRLLSKNIGAAAGRKYPLQARLYATQAGAEINIGSAVGLRQGTQFDILYEADAEAIPEATAVVVKGIRGNVAPVLLTGIDSHKLPATAEDGLYVRIHEVREATE